MNEVLKLATNDNDLPVLQSEYDELKAKVTELESDLKLARTDIIHYKAMVGILPNENLYLARRNVELEKQLKEAKTRIVTLTAACTDALEFIIINTPSQEYLTFVRSGKEKQLCAAIRGE